MKIKIKIKMKTIMKINKKKKIINNKPILKFWISWIRLQSSNNHSSRRNKKIKFKI